jgi:hypothetical protein
MTNSKALRRSLALILGGTLTCALNTGFAFNMGNMMNPSKWMGGDRGRDYDDGFIQQLSCFTLLLSFMASCRDLDHCYGY